MSRTRLLPRMIWATLVASASLASASCTLIPKRDPAPVACLSLIPEEWKEEVPAADLPANTKEGWVTFALEQTDALSKANGRQQDTLTVVAKCDRLNAH